MKKRLFALALSAALAFSLAACGGQSSTNNNTTTDSVTTTAETTTTASNGEAPNYSDKACWYQIPEITKDVDTFFVYPTEYMAANEGDPDYAPLDNAEMLEGVKTNYPILASVYEDSTNVFMPYYRQAGMMFAAEEAKKSGDPRTAFATVPYSDVTAALDYYFENYNNGRPFIIAGHSQGSGIVSLVLKYYFKEHPDYYERMIAAYVIGFSITKEYLKENAHLKFATGESDTGVIISWNTEGPKNVEQNASNVVLLPNAISINPLNWKLDDTYAPASENLGSRVLNEKTGEYEIKDVGADAKVVPNRGYRTRRRRHLWSPELPQRRLRALFQQHQGQRSKANCGLQGEQEITFIRKGKAVKI